MGGAVLMWLAAAGAISPAGRPAGRRGRGSLVASLPRIEAWLRRRAVRRLLIGRLVRYG